MIKRSGDYLKLGLTGGIGSGKTTVARRFSALGAHVYEADAVSRRALDPGAACYGRVVSAFGPQIVSADGVIDRKKLGRIVFADEEKRRLLNGIIHPYVIEALLKRAERELASQPGAIAVFDVPLLFESGMDAAMDGSIVLAGEEETRVRRVMERDGLSRDQVLARIRAQMPEEERRLRADFTLENNGTVAELFSKVDALYDALKREGSGG